MRAIKFQTTPKVQYIHKYTAIEDTGKECGKL